MVSLGVGWNFLFVRGTVLLGRAHHPAERFRAQAVNDFSVSDVRRRFPERRLGAVRLELARRAAGGHAAHRNRDVHIGRGAPGRWPSAPPGGRALNAPVSAALLRRRRLVAWHSPSTNGRPCRRCRHQFHQSATTRAGQREASQQPAGRATFRTTRPLLPSNPALRTAHRWALRCRG